MSLEPPSPSNGYNVTVFHKLSVEVWQAILSSLHGRLNGLEAVAGSFETALGAEAVAIAQGRIDDAIVPQLTQVKQEMTAIQQAIALAEDQLAALQSGGVKAENVPLAGATDLFPMGTNAQEAFGYIEEALVALANGKVDKSAKASIAEAKAGQSDSTWLTPSTGAAMIGALGADADLQVFIESGTLTKEDGDFAYYIEMWGGGGGGGAGDYMYGGRGGAFASGFVLADELPDNVSIIVGSGGSGATVWPGNGTSGGESKFGDKLLAPGGGAGSGTSSSVHIEGTFGESFFSGTSPIGNRNTPGNSYKAGGTGAGGNSGNIVGRAGGTSYFAGNGGSGPGGAGMAPAGGGGGHYNGRGGNGARGEVRVYRFKRRKAG